MQDCGSGASALFGQEIVWDIWIDLEKGIVGLIEPWCYRVHDRLKRMIQELTPTVDQMTSSYTYHLQGVFRPLTKNTG